jgi:hypothetical protein
VLNLDQLNSDTQRRHSRKNLKSIDDGDHRYTETMAEVLGLKKEFTYLAKIRGIDKPYNVNTDNPERYAAQVSQTQMDLIQLAGYDAYHLPSLQYLMVINPKNVVVVRGEKTGDRRDTFDREDANRSGLVKKKVKVKGPGGKEYESTRWVKPAVATAAVVGAGLVGAGAIAYLKGRNKESPKKEVVNNPRRQAEPDPWESEATSPIPRPTWGAQAEIAPSTQNIPGRPAPKALPPAKIETTVTPPSNNKVKKVVARNISSVPESVSHEDLIAAGDRLIPPEMKSRLDDLVKDGNVFEHRKTQADKVRTLKKELLEAKAGRGSRSLDQIKKDARKEFDKLRVYESQAKEASSLMSDLRSKLIESSPVSAQQAAEIVSKIKIEPEVSRIIPESKLRSHAEDFYRLTGGKGSSTLSSFTIEGARPSASAAKRNVNLGAIPSREMIFHEMAHHIEYEDKRVGRASVDWVISRAEGKLSKLKDLTGKGYNDTEVAVPDKFITPYVGKLNPVTNAAGKVVAKSTSEVVSVGLERLTSPEAMAKFYMGDPEHFKFVLGVLRHG